MSANLTALHLVMRPTAILFLLSLVGVAYIYYEYRRDRARLGWVYQAGMSSTLLLGFALPHYRNWIAAVGYILFALCIREVNKFAREKREKEAQEKGASSDPPQVWPPPPEPPGLAEP